MNHLFLKDKEWSSKARAEVPVKAIGKFLDGEQQATDLIKDGRYGLSADDFWILKTSSKDNSVIYYTAVCMTHTGCMKVNAYLSSEQRFDPSCVEGPFDDGYADGLILYPAQSHMIEIIGDSEGITLTEIAAEYRITKGAV